VIPDTGYRIPTLLTTLTAVMDQIFNPTRRLRDLWEEASDDPFEYAEVQLAAPVDEFLICRWDWADFRLFVMGGAKRKIMWLTAVIFLTVDDDLDLEDVDIGYDAQVTVYFTATSGEKQKLHLWAPTNSECDEYLPCAVCSVLWRAMMTSNSVKLTLQSFSVHGLSSGPVLSQFVVESTQLRVLQFKGLFFEEDHCRALATLQRTDLEVKFYDCTLEPEDAEGTFIEWFRRNQVVTDLHWCTTRSSSIISALSGNSSVKGLFCSGDLRASTPK
jgi:hypothetical protein